MKQFIKKIMFKSLVKLRRVTYILFYLCDKFILMRKSNLIILCYHGISNSDWRFNVSLEEFKKQINYLIQEGYQFTTLDHVLGYINGRNKINAKSVVINFDDGYKNLMQIRSFIKKTNIKPSLFLLSDIKSPNRKELGNNQPFLNSSEINKLIKDGWEIGSHSGTHSNLINLSPENVKKEVIQSKKDLEKLLKIKIIFFAYPKGKYNKYVLNEVKTAGYKMALTMDDGKILKKCNPLLIPRIGVDNTHTFAEFKGTISPSAIDFRKFVKNTKLGEYL